MTIQDLKFDEKGLIPAVVQDFFTKRVLTVAYMNAESLAVTLREKRTCFWSRSRQELWRKGETSGNVQHVVSVTADCDGDALVVEVIKEGPACHLGTDSCFTNLLFEDETVQRFTLQALYELLQQRNAERPEGSYTTYLFQKGRDHWRHEKQPRRNHLRNLRFVLSCTCTDGGDGAYAGGCARGARLAPYHRS